MSDALEIQIEAALTDALRDILIEGGYYTDLGTHVFEEPKLEDELNDTLMPCAFVVPGEEAATDGCNGGRYGSVFEFWVVIYARASAGEIKALLSRLKADVKKRVLTDPSLGLGTVTNEFEWGGAKRSIDVVEGRGAGRVALRFLLSAEWSPSAA